MKLAEKHGVVYCTLEEVLLSKRNQNIMNSAWIVEKPGMNQILRPEEKEMKKWNAPFEFCQN